MEKSQHKTAGKFISQFLIELNQQVELGQDATDQDFLRFQRTINANVRSGPKARNDILLKKLFQAHPEFYTESAQSKTLSTGLLEQVCEAPNQSGISSRKQTNTMRQNMESTCSSQPTKP